MWVRRLEIGHSYVTCFGQRDISRYDNQRLQMSLAVGACSLVSLPSPWEGQTEPSPLVPDEVEGHGGHSPVTPVTGEEAHPDQTTAVKEFPDRWVQTRQMEPLSWPPVDSRSGSIHTYWSMHLSFCGCLLISTMSVFLSMASPSHCTLDPGKPFFSGTSLWPSPPLPLVSWTLSSLLAVSHQHLNHFNSVLSFSSQIIAFCPISLFHLSSYSPFPFADRILKEKVYPYSQIPLFYLPFNFATHFPITQLKVLLPWPPMI